MPSFGQREEFFRKLVQREGAGSRIWRQIVALAALAFAYGVVMGSYHSVTQALAAGLKVGALMFLTLLICFPAFYVIQMLFGSRLRLHQMVSIVLSGFVLCGAIMLSFAPIVVFFLLTGGHYHFLQLLHIAIFALSGIFGMKMVVDALQYSCEKENVYPRVGVAVFRFWVVILAFVGIQLAWNLRPFLGDRDCPFELFRDYEGNFYTALIYAAQQLLSGEDDELSVTPTEGRSAPEPPPRDSVLLQHLYGE